MRARQSPETLVFKSMPNTCCDFNRSQVRYKYNRRCKKTEDCNANAQGPHCNQSCPSMFPSQEERSTISHTDFMIRWDIALPFVPCKRVSLDSMHNAASEPLSPFKTIIFDGPALHILLVQAPLTFEQMPKPLTFEQVLKPLTFERVLKPLTSDTDDNDAKIQTV